MDDLERRNIERVRKLQQDEDKSRTSWIVHEARTAGWWIYHEPSKRWYTPEEFEAADILVTVGNRPTDKIAYKVMNPMVGLKRRIDFLKKVSDEYFAFKKRIDDYYTTELKKK